MSPSAHRGFSSGARAMSALRIESAAARRPASESVRKWRIPARRAESEILRGRYRGPLHGVPYAIKDLFLTRGIRTTCGSRILGDFVPAFDATVVERLAEAGAILLGKLNMHEFAVGSSGSVGFRGPARNPWALDHVAGGSSSGSGVAVAAGLCYGAVGTDTGGSIRIPAACCGVVGFKPTHGHVSARGVVPLSPSYDHVGPLARTVCVCKSC